MSKKLGRPPRISRETVLEAAAGIAAADPQGSVSIGAIARQLEVTPMAIYTYFPSKDVLLQALSERLLDGFETAMDEALPCLERVRIWAMRVRRHFLANPPLIRMLSWEGGHNSVAWLNTSEPLLKAIRGLGLDDETFSKVVLWTWAVVLGAVQFEIYDRTAVPRLNEEELSGLGPAVRDDIAKVDHFMRDEGSHDSYFAFQIDRMVDALAHLPGAVPPGQA